MYNDKDPRTFIINTWLIFSLLCRWGFGQSRLNALPILIWLFVRHSALFYVIKSTHITLFWSSLYSYFPSPFIFFFLSVSLIPLILLSLPPSPSPFLFLPHYLIFFLPILHSFFTISSFSLTLLPPTLDHPHSPIQLPSLKPSPLSSLLPPPPPPP